MFSILKRFGVKNKRKELHKEFRDCCVAMIGSFVVTYALFRVFLARF